MAAHATTLPRDIAAIIDDYAEEQTVATERHKAILSIEIKVCRVAGIGAAYGPMYGRIRRLLRSLVAAILLARDMRPLAQRWHAHLFAMTGHHRDGIMGMFEPHDALLKMSAHACRMYHRIRDRHHVPTDEERQQCYNGVFMDMTTMLGP